MTVKDPILVDAETGKWPARSAPLHESLEDLDFTNLFGLRAFYLSGRLIQRMRWHLIEAVLLSPEVYDATDLEKEMWRSPTDEAADLNERYWASLKQKQNLLKFRERDALKQRRLFDQATNLLARALEELPFTFTAINRAVQGLEDQLKCLREQLADDLPSLHVCEFHVKPSMPVNELIAATVSEYIQPFVTSVTSTILGDTDRQARAILQAGAAIEQGQCPNDVGHYLRKRHTRRTWSHDPRVPQARPAVTTEDSAVTTEDEAQASASDLDQPTDVNPFIVQFHETFATIERRVGDLRPQYAWWDRSLVTFEQLDQFGQPLKRAWLKARAERDGRTLQRERLFGLLELLDKYLAPAKPVQRQRNARPMKSDFLWGPFRLRFDKSSGQLQRAGKKTVTLPKGKLRTIFAKLLEADEKGFHAEDLAKIGVSSKKLRPPKKSARPPEESALYSQMCRLREVIRPLGVGISRAPYLIEELETAG